MEKSSVVTYQRSITKNRLMYDPFIGDGDSSAYREVCKLQVYGPTKLIQKEEDIGHVTKRMGNQLRSVVRDHKGKKLADGKCINGKGRLTNTRIDAFQSLYGHVLRKNKGDAAAMSTGVSAILKHYSSTEEKPQHDDCPVGKESWCRYQSDIVTGEQTYRPKILLPQQFKLSSNLYLINWVVKPF